MYNKRIKFYIEFTVAYFVEASSQFGDASIQLGDASTQLHDASKMQL